MRFLTICTARTVCVLFWLGRGAVNVTPPEGANVNKDVRERPCNPTDIHRGERVTNNEGAGAHKGAPLRECVVLRLPSVFVFGVAPTER